MHKKWRRLLVKKQLDLKNGEDLQLNSEVKIQHLNPEIKPKKEAIKKQSFKK